MKKIIREKSFRIRLFLLLMSLSFFAAQSLAQTQTLLKRTTYKTETVELGAGGTVSVTGAPNGSISIEGWQKNEVEISAEVEIQATTEKDLTELAKINGFAIDADMVHVRITTVGTYDKEYIKRLGKKFPKNLLGLPFKVDYKIKVPVYCDINIDGGKGDLTVSKIEGAFKINYLDANAKLFLTGGSVVATFGAGAVDVIIPNRSWRGRSADVQVASGTLNVQVPLNLNANLDAKVLRSGKIENNLTNLKPRDRSKFTEQSILAKAGNGGAFLSFIIGDGNLKLQETEK